MQSTSCKLSVGKYKMPFNSGGRPNVLKPVFLRAKIVDVTLALNTTHFLRNETAYLPWESAIRNLDYFILMFDRSEVYGPMQACVIEILFTLLH